MSPRLTVNRAELLEGLKQLSQLVKKKSVGEGTLTYEQGSLIIDLSGITIEAAAEGEFPTPVRLSGAALLKLAGVLPADGPIVFQAELPPSGSSKTTWRRWWKKPYAGLTGFSLRV